jgi:hypothetical protein
MILGSLSDHLAIIARCDDDRIRISIPNILKYKEEHKRKSPHVPPLNAPKSRVEESRVEVTAAAFSTIAEEPVPEPEPSAAAAEVEPSADFPDFPVSRRLIALEYPGTDRATITRIIAAACRGKPDASDDEVAEVLIRTHKGKLQLSAALWLMTVPAFFAFRDGPKQPAVCPECGGYGSILSHEYDGQPNSAWTDLPEVRTHVECPRCRGDTLRKPVESELRELVYAGAKGAS